MNHRALTNSELTLELVPSPDASLEAIGQFASTFNGYEHWGSFEKCAEIANAEMHDSLTNLRTCLFFEWRRWNHYGDEPDEEAQAQWRELVEGIRRHVTEGKLE